MSSYQLRCFYCGRWRWMGRMEPAHGVFRRFLFSRRRVLRCSDYKECFGRVDVRIGGGPHR